MYILGIQNDIDAGVCLLQDGRVLEAVSEERFTRVKLNAGLPARSLEYVLHKHRIGIADVDCVTYGWYGRQTDYPEYVKKLVSRIVPAVQKAPDAGDMIVQRVVTELDRDQKTRDAFSAWMRELGVPDSKIVYLDHHACHAWSAFSTSPFDEAFVFTFDGRGDLKCGSASFASTVEGIHEYDNLLSFDSLGFLYGQITHYLGFTPHRHEGKVTGLAAFGNPENGLPLFRRIIDWDGDTIRSNLGLYRPFYTNLRPELIAELDKLSKEDVAAALQRHCEDLATRYIAHWMKVIDQPSVRNVCVAGGLFANVKLNQRVLELDGVDNVFVFPHMGDGGLPLGSACLQHWRSTGKAKVAFETAYLGPAFGEAEIVAALRTASDRIEWTRMRDKVGEAVEDLRANRVVGYFDGRMEYGPRALGARSILFNARDGSVNDWLNKRFDRTEFMPFAPVTPEEYAPECYKGWQSAHECARFMTITYDCHDAFRAKHPAVVHVDGTARPQIVQERLNGDYYRIVRAYCDATNERALINTSFNRHEEPIVCSPADAIGSLVGDMIDVLVIGDYRATLKH